MVLTVAILWSFAVPNRFFHQILFGVFLPKLVLLVGILFTRTLFIIMDLYERLPGRNWIQAILSHILHFIESNDDTPEPHFRAPMSTVPSEKGDTKWTHCDNNGNSADHHRTRPVRRRTVYTRSSLLRSTRQRNRPTSSINS
ncbi:uncharacterized protein LOC111246165 [Varroa destructor]|uniref:Uncharacterized protein n=1 Tax=Varroa destructor TaxID=109461 RepID=A0A7M7JIT1_VARDE|nr:uncharacterized protein LOC111246165 [Varroa destructor]